MQGTRVTLSKPSVPFFQTNFMNRRTVRKTCAIVALFFSSGMITLYHQSLNEEPSNFKNSEIPFKRTLSDGSIQEGKLVNGVEEGPFKYTLQNGATFKGSFMKGVINGPYTLTLPNGEVYEGNILNGKQDGPCKRVLSIGSSIGK